MKAVCWHGPNHVEVETVPDPGYIPTMKRGDVLGREFMGELVGDESNQAMKKKCNLVLPLLLISDGLFYGMLALLLLYLKSR